MEGGREGCVTHIHTRACVNTHSNLFQYGHAIIAHMHQHLTRHAVSHSHWAAKTLSQTPAVCTRTCVTYETVCNGLTEQPRRTVIRPLTPTDPDPNLSPTLRSHPLKGRQSVEKDQQPLHTRAPIPGKDPPCALRRQQSVFNTPQKHVPSGGSGIVHARPFRIVSDQRRRQ